MTKGMREGKVKFRPDERVYRRAGRAGEKMAENEECRMQQRCRQKQWEK